MSEHERVRGNREEWAKRVERWRDSGLTTAEFASELGVNPRTLTYWKWLLGKEGRGEKRVWPKRRLEAPSRPPQIAAPTPGLIEIEVGSIDMRFELELRGGQRLRVPPGFDPVVLSRLLDVLEAR
jgi:transposase-like protein